MENQKHRFAGSVTRAEASTRGAAHDPDSLGSLGGNYARDAHPGGLGDDYARDGGFSGGGNHEDFAREPESVRPMEAKASSSPSQTAASGSRRLRGISDVEQSHTASHQSAATRHPDDVLALSVWRCIASAHDINSSSIQVSAAAGAIILAGTVPSMEQKERVEVLAYRCDGVRSVQNALWIDR